MQAAIVALIIISAIFLAYLYFSAKNNIINISKKSWIVIIVGEAVFIIIAILIMQNYQT